MVNKMSYANLGIKVVSVGLAGCVFLVIYSEARLGEKKTTDHIDPTPTINFEAAYLTDSAMVSSSTFSSATFSDYKGSRFVGPL
jgi:hypothetical protein